MSKVTGKLQVYFEATFLSILKHYFQLGFILEVEVTKQREVYKSKAYAKRSKEESIKF